MESAEPEEKLSVERLFYDNLLLLGFEAGALAKKYSASLGADMFRRSNPKAMEIVVYFLLLKIAPEQTKDNFKSVWPAVDRDQQRDFKKLAFEALERLEKEGRIPPNSVRLSHLQTCFGERFYLLMWNLSLHALRVVLKREHPEATVPVIPLDVSSAKRAAQISRVLKAQIVMQTDLLLGTATRGAAAQHQWREFAARVQVERKDLSYQLTEVKDMQTRVEEELKKLPSLDEATQAQHLRHVRATWQTLSQQASVASATAPTLEQILARTCNSVRLEAPNGERIEPAALAEHWRASLSELQRSAGGVLTVPAATKTLLEEQVRSHETQLAALRSLNAALSSSLVSIQASIPSLLEPSSTAASSATAGAGAAAAPLFVPPTPARLPKTAATSHIRPAASRRLQTLPDMVNDEERLSQNVHAAAERSMAPIAQPPSQMTAPISQPQATVAAAHALATPATVAQLHAAPASRVAQTSTLAAKPFARKAPATAAKQSMTKILEPEEEKENDADDSLTQLAEEYAQQIRPTSAVAAKATQTKAQAKPAPAKSQPALPKTAKSIAKTAAKAGDVWSPAPARSERLAGMRARAQALLAASPPLPPAPAPVFASPPPPAVTKSVPVSLYDADGATAADDEPVLSDLSLSVLSTALPSPVVGDGAPPVFELGSSPPLFEPSSLRAGTALPTFTLEDALTLSPLQL